MSNIEYVNYNSYRRPEFQVSTIIYRENGKKYVKKTGINDSTGLIKRFEDNYALISKLYKGITPLKGRTEGDSVVFNYVEGTSLDSIIFEKLNVLSKEEFLAFLKSIIGELFTVNTSEESFIADERFISVFGKVNLPEHTPSAKGINIDMLFSNIVYKDGQYINFDYEWVFDFSVPLDFSIYRALYYFYTENKKVFDSKDIEIKELMIYCGITDSYLSIYEEMEADFQCWVFEKDNYIRKYYKNNDIVDLGELIKRDKELRAHVKYLDSHIEELGKAIDAFKAENERLNRENERITGENERLVDDNDIFKFDVRQKDLVILDRETNLNNANNEIGRLNGEINRLNQEIDHLRQHVIGLDTYRQTWEYYYNKPVVQVAKYPYRFARKVYDGTVDLLKGNKNKGQNETINTEDTGKQVDGKTLVVPKFDNPAVSIVIPAYNQFEYTYECVKSIIAFTENIPYEVILADDCSTDNTKEIDKYIEGINHIRNKDNLRFLKNCNNAASHSKGKYILFLNNDTRVTENWLSSLVELIESDDSIGMVGSKLLYPDGKLQEAGGIIWKDASAWNYGNGQDPEAPEFNYVRDVDYISGAAIMIKADLWKQLGGFDERFAPAYCEDSDLAFQVRGAGYRVVYQPQSVVVHYEGVSNGTDTTTGLKQYQVINTEKFKEKWENVLKSHFENGEKVFIAKDRNYSCEKTVLVIDHYVPEFDKDAGSRTIFQYLKLFISKGYHVKFLGDNLCQTQPYTSVLQQMGIEVLYGGWYVEHLNEWFKDNLKYVNYVFLNRPHISIKYIDIIRKNSNARMMYYGMDLHFVRMERQYEITKDEYQLYESKKWKRTELEILNSVDVVYYLSTVEKEIVNNINPNVLVKNLKINVYDKFRDDINYNFENKKDIVFVGGFAHTPNRDAVFWFVNEVFPIIKKSVDLTFNIVGSNPPEEILELEQEGVAVRGYMTDEDLEELYNSCRLSVVPLRYGAGIKGKVIEAIYNGVPVVTTSVGAEGIEGIEDIVAIKDDPQELAETIIELYSDIDRLSQMAYREQEFIKKMFSIDAAWDVIKDDFS